MIEAFVFVVALFLPVFGGHVTVTFSAETLEGCAKLRKVVDKEMTGFTMRYSITERTRAR